MCVMRRSDGDTTFQSQYHCCIHSHMKAYPDKGVEIGKTAWPSRGQGPDKAAIKGPQCGQAGLDKVQIKRRTRGLGTRTAGGHHNDPQQAWPLEAGGGQCLPARPEDGQQENNWRTREKKRTRGGQEKDKMTRGGREGQKYKRRTQGWPAQPEDNSLQDERRTRPGHKGRTQSSGRGQPAWPAPFFLRENPAVNCFFLFKLHNRRPELMPDHSETLSGKLRTK